MPFSSEKQRRYLWSQHPDIAQAWAHGRSSVTGKRESPSQRGKRKTDRVSSSPSSKGGGQMHARNRKHRGGRKHGRKGR